jgi:hypothetical protein
MPGLAEEHLLKSDSSTHNRQRRWVFPQVLGFVALKALVGAGVYRETVVVGTCMAFICIMSPEFSGNG